MENMEIQKIAGNIDQKYFDKKGPKSTFDILVATSSRHSQCGPTTSAEGQILRLVQGWRC